MSENEVQRAVEQLKLDGYQVEFLHWRVPEGCTEHVRYSRKDGWLTNDPAYGIDWKYGPPDSNGGTTQCSIIYTRSDNTDELVTQAHTHCRSNESFCYAQGRRYSLVRALQQMEINLPFLEKPTYSPIKGALCGRIKGFDPSIREGGIVW